MFQCSFNEFVGEKVVSPSYSSAILAPPLIDIVKPKFTCLMHREAGETATLEFVTEFYSGHQSRRMDSSCSKDQHCLIVFEKHFLKDKFVGKN